MIPKYGLEGTLFLKDDPDAGVTFAFDEEEPSQTCCGVKLRLFQEVRVQLSLDQTNVQHEKLVLRLVEPRIPGFSAEPTREEEEEKEEGEKEEGRRKGRKRTAENGVPIEKKQRKR